MTPKWRPRACGRDEEGNRGSDSKGCRNRTGAGSAFRLLPPPPNTPLRKKLNGRGRPPETRRDGNAVARAARRERLPTSPRGGLPVRLRLGPGSARPRGDFIGGTAFRSSGRTNKLEVALWRRDFNPAKTSARTQRRSGPTPLPARLQTWGRETQPRLAG